MKCECGYEGKPEFGIFETKYFWKNNIRCLECKSTEHFVIFPEEHVEMELRYPSECSGSIDYGKHKPVDRVVEIFKGFHGIGAYSIYCPVCDWGSGGGLTNEECDRLLKLKKELWSV